MIRDLRSERPRESINPSAPNKFIWESLSRAEHFSSMQIMSQNGQAETIKFGEVSKMEKEVGAHLVNKWKHRGDYVSITCLVFLATGKVGGL